MSGTTQGSTSIELCETGFCVTQWTWTTLGSLPTKTATQSSTKLLSDDQKSVNWRIRIISAPRDRASQDFKKFLEHFHVPYEFRLERQQAVNHSVGRRFGDQISFTWFRLVCKNINVKKTQGTGGWFFKDGPLATDRTWFDSSYVLIEDRKSSHRATLLCFGVSERLTARFDDMRPSQELFSQPALIFGVIFESLFCEMDDAAWMLAEVFHGAEEDGLKTLAMFEKSTSAAFNFARLHNVSKHAIFFLEAFQAGYEIIDGLLKVYEPGIDTDVKIVELMFRHRAQLFKSSRLRVESLERRISKITDMSFNVVTQRDSRLMVKDSGSMKVIAVMTLIFLPSSLVATLFSSSFFDFDLDNQESGGKGRVRISKLFWVFWAVAIPLTLTTLISLLVMRARRVRNSVEKVEN